MASVAERIAELNEQIRQAVAITQSDPGASRVLTAVAVEFRNKSAHALETSEDADEAEVWDAVVELEQAADSAKMAVEADVGIEERTREAILDAHDAVADLKEEMQTR